LSWEEFAVEYVKLFAPRMASTADTSEADVPVPVKRRMDGVTNELSGTAAAFAGIPTVVWGVPQAVKAIGRSAANAMIATR
jgi:hypothetical protein